MTLHGGTYCSEHAVGSTEGDEMKQPRVQGADEGYLGHRWNQRGRDLELALQAARAGSDATTYEDIHCDLCCCDVGDRVASTIIPCLVNSRVLLRPRSRASASTRQVSGSINP